MGEKYEECPDSCGFTSLEALFFILTLVKAALFTGIVTAFTVDAMSALDEDTPTKLLRIIAENSISGQGGDMPQAPPSIVWVNALWLLSITSSLAAAAWAMLGFEWCTFLKEGVPAENYEEMAEKRQRRFETVRRWKMHTVVASIPFLLHVSLFLFLAGLWLRVRDMNKQLGLVVGIPGLVLGSTYMIVTLLPMFTDAPFFTSFSVVVRPLVDEIRHLFKFRRFIHAPPIIKWISSPFVWALGRRSGLFLYYVEFALDTVLSTLYRVYPAFATILGFTVELLHMTLFSFQPGGSPFEELRMLKNSTSTPDRDKEVRQRALFWLMSTNLTHSELKEVLKELSNLRSLAEAEEPLDHFIVNLLVTSLSSVLEDGRITEDERPIFDHCIRLLTEEMDQTFRDANHDPGILVRNTEVSNGLKQYVYFDASVLPPQASGDAYEGYWDNVIRLLWLSPSRGKIRFVINQLEPRMQSMKPSLLQRIVRGLHAATITSLDPNNQQSILDFPLPDFRKWPEDQPGLDKELSVFLRNLLVEFHKAVHPNDRTYDSPTTIPSLIVGCIKLLDRYPKEEWGVSLKFPSALCSFVTVVWRNNPSAFDANSSVAKALVTSIPEFISNSTPDTPNFSDQIVIRLSAIVNGPKSVTQRIASLYTGPVKDDLGCLSMYIHVIAAVLEAVLLARYRPEKDNFYGITPEVMKTIVPTLFFTDRRPFDYSRDHSDHRLPYIYSLAIALSCGIGETRWNSSEVLGFLGTPVGEKNVTVERILDTNVLVVAVLKHLLSRVLTEAELRREYLDPVTQALEPLEGIIEDRETYSQRTRWKAIYLLADIRNILPQELTGFEDLQTHINNASNAVKTYIAAKLIHEHAPRDWEKRRGGLRLCGLEEEVREFARRNETTDRIYPGGILVGTPILPLYPQQIRPEPASRFLYHLSQDLELLL